VASNLLTEAHPEPDGVCGSAAGHPVLSRLISVQPDRFAADYWGRQPLLSTAADLSTTFTDLISAADIDELVSERGLRTPFLRVARSGTTLADKAFTAPGGVGAGVADQVSDDKLVQLFADGSTMVLQALHRIWPPIITLCQQLASELGHPVQANAYVTPPQSQGFSSHYDVHDVFVLQIEGEKRWQIHPPVLDAPLRDQPWSERRTAVERRARETPSLDVVLRPGDCLYLPRGFLHAATALGGVSTHLTIGVHAWTRFGLAEQLVQQALHTAASQPAVRQSLALGVDFADPGSWRDDVEVVRSALISALQQADVDQLAATLRRTARGTSRAAPIGPLRQLRDAGQITAETEIVLRAHLNATLDQQGQGSVIRSRAASFDVVEDDSAAVKTLLTTGRVQAGDLGLDLARRLVLAGLAVVV